MLWSWTDSGRKYRALGDRCQLLFSLDRGAKAIDSGAAAAITRPSRTRSSFNAPSDKRFLASSRRTLRAGRDEAKACSSVLSSRVPPWVHSRRTVLARALALRRIREACFRRRALRAVDYGDTF